MASSSTPPLNTVSRPNVKKKIIILLQIFPTFTSVKHKEIDRNNIYIYFYLLSLYYFFTTFCQLEVLNIVLKHFGKQTVTGVRNTSVISFIWCSHGNLLRVDRDGANVMLFPHEVAQELCLVKRIQMVHLYYMTCKIFN